MPHLTGYRPHRWLAYGLGAGLFPWAPGTLGTLVAIPLYLLLRPLPFIGYVGLLSLLFLIGVWVCGKTARELEVQDPSTIVWDEVLGFLLAMTAAPPGWPWLLAGFLLFRGLDILKPWPIGALDRRLQGGLGIMLDDIAAGAMTCGLLQAAVYLSG